MRFVGLLSSLVTASLIGCSGAAPPDSTGAESNRSSAASPNGAIAAFSADPAIAAELKAHPDHLAPAALLSGSSRTSGASASEYLVVTHYDVTPPGLFDASVIETVLATVSFGPRSSTPTVTRVDVAKNPEDILPSSVTGKPGADTAIAVYRADERIKAELEGKGSPPQAALYTTRASTGGVLEEYLVISLVDRTPPGVRDALHSIPVAATVFFNVTGDPLVTPVKIVPKPTPKR